MLRTIVVRLVSRHRSTARSTARYSRCFSSASLIDDNGLLSSCTADKLQSQLQTNGYTMIPGFFSPAQAEALMHRADELVSNFEPSAEERSVFSTTKQQLVKDRYFLESADKIRFFFEEGAFDQEGKLLVPKSKSINKLGHALHARDPVFKSFLEQPLVKQVATQVIGIAKPSLVQSMYIFKQPNIGGEVSPHIDSTFLYTDPPTCHALWFALEDATIDNGCLWLYPGSHIQPIRRRFVREGETLRMVHSDPPENWDTSKFVPAPVKQGTLIIFHGALAHFSYPNKSSASRHALTLHMVDSEAAWSKDNWLQPTPEYPFPTFT